MGNQNANFPTMKTDTQNVVCITGLEGSKYQSPVSTVLSQGRLPYVGAALTSIPTAQLHSGWPLKQLASRQKEKGWGWQTYTQALIMKLSHFFWYSIPEELGRCQYHHMHRAHSIWKETLSGRRIYLHNSAYQS